MIMCADLITKIEKLEAALRAVARNDQSHYSHHQRRHWDGKRPTEVGSTIWLTPREIARTALDEPTLATSSDIAGKVP